MSGMPKWKEMLLLRCPHSEVWADSTEYAKYAIIPHRHHITLPILLSTMCWDKKFDVPTEYVMVGLRYVPAKPLQLMKRHLASRRGPIEENWIYLPSKLGFSFRYCVVSGTPCFRGTGYSTTVGIMGG